MRPPQSRLSQRFLAILVFACLWALTGLEPLAHAHDLDLVPLDPDCPVCHWHQSGHALQPISLDAELQISTREVVPPWQSPPVGVPCRYYLARSPPG